MACPACTLRLLRPSKRTKPLSSSTTSRRAFTTSPPHQRLGAFTYAQEWQTGTYHYNKALTKSLPVAAQRTDELLTMYATQVPRRTRTVGEDKAKFHALVRGSVMAQRRTTNRVLIGKSSAKDFGNHVKVTALVYDGFAAEEEAARVKETARGRRMDGKGGAQQGGGANRRPPGGGMGRRVMGNVESNSAAPARARFRQGAAARPLGLRNQMAGAGKPAGMVIRSVPSGGDTPRSTAPRPVKSP